MNPSLWEMGLVLRKVGAIDDGFSDHSFCFTCEKERRPIIGKSPDCLYCIYARVFPNGPIDYLDHGFRYISGMVIPREGYRLPVRSQ